MQMLSSASRTGSDPASAVECATTTRIPISRHVRRIRRAISPRFAIRILENIGSSAPSASGHKAGLDVLDADAEPFLEGLGDGLALAQVSEKLADPGHAPAIHEVLADDVGQLVRRPDRVGSEQTL